jgi:hypothetical protein
MHEHDIAPGPCPCANSTARPILPWSSPIKRPFCSCLLSSPCQPPSSTSEAAADLPCSRFHGRRRPPSPKQLCEPLELAIPHRSATATLPRHHQLPPFGERPACYSPSPILCSGTFLMPRWSCRDPKTHSSPSTLAVVATPPRERQRDPPPRHSDTPPSKPPCLVCSLFIVGHRCEDHIIGQATNACHQPRHVSHPARTECALWSIVGTRSWAGLATLGRVGLAAWALWHQVAPAVEPGQAGHFWP